MAGNNPYDSFDASPTEPVAPRSANPYDHFDQAPRVAPAKPKPQESPYSLKNQAGAAVEPFMSLMTGAFAAPVSGFAGMAGAALPGPQGQGASWAERTGQALTYQPHTQGGATALDAISYPFKQWAAASEGVGGRLAEATGSPAIGAGENALLQLIPQMLGARGAGNFAKMDRAPIPKPPADVQLLADKGVTMTPGQIKGGTAKRLEEKVSSIPIVGDAIREAKVKGVEQFNRAAVEDALSPIGAKLPTGIKGNKAIEWARHALSDAYEKLLPNLVGDLDYRGPNQQRALPSTAGQVGAPPRQTLRDELQQLRGMGQNMPELQRSQLERIIDKEIIERFSPQGKADGHTIQKVDEKLGNIKRQMRQSADYDIRNLGDAVAEMQNALRRMRNEVNPTHRGALEQIDQGYSKFKIAQRAASSTGAKEGVFTPTQYHGSVKARDASKDKARFAEGNANQQELSSAGKKRLPDELGDSGTTDRLLLAEMIRKPWWIAPAWGASMLYSQPALRWMQSMMLRPPQLGPRALQAMPTGAEQQGNIPSPPR